MNQIEIFNSPEFGSIRTLEQNGKVLFCGTDVATALGYTNPRKAVRDHGRFLRIRTKPLLTSRPLTLCRKSVGMSDATRTAGAKQLPSQACFIAPIAAARCMSTAPTTASAFLNTPAHSTPKFLAERSARPSTVSTKMWYCPLSRKC